MLFETSETENPSRFQQKSSRHDGAQITKITGNQHSPGIAEIIVG